MISDWTLKTYQSDTDLQPTLKCRDAIASKKFVTKKKDTVTLPRNIFLDAIASLQFSIGCKSVSSLICF